jgi:hypothetical protein
MKKTLIPAALLLATTSISHAADFDAGKQAYIRGDYKMAYDEFMPLAQKGDSKSQVGVGLLYAKGQGVEQSDVEALRWFTLVATKEPRPNVFVRTVAEENSKVLARRMTPQQRAEATRLIETTRLAQIGETPTDAGGPEKLIRVAATGSPPVPSTPLVVTPPEPPKMQAQDLPPLPEAPKAPEAMTRQATKITPPPAQSAIRPPVVAPSASRTAPMPAPVQAQALPPAPYHNKTILPGSRNGPTTTISVIPPKQPPTTVIASPYAPQTPVKQANAAMPPQRSQMQRPMQTAALTPPKPARVAKGGAAYLIQLGAYRNSPRSVAERAWQRILRKHGDIIGRNEPVIRQADLGAKGVYQRLRVGPYATKHEAKTICEELRSRHQRCYVIRGQL